MKEKLVFMAIILLALSLRIYGLNWDQNRHIHPDERFLTMVATAATLPPTFVDYLDPLTSTLNPYNLDFEFFVYGTLPLTLTKITAVLFEGFDTYDGIALTGRFLSAIADVGTLIMLYLIARTWEKLYKLPKALKYWVAGLYAVAVLPIQNAHFFTVDSQLVFFVFGAVYFAVRNQAKLHIVNTAMVGLFMGCALGAKVAALYSLPLIVGLGLVAVWTTKSSTSRKLFLILLHGLVFGALSYISLRVADPHIFSSANLLNPLPSAQFLANIEELHRLSDPTTSFPPSLQWLSKQKLVFPLTNIVFFGLGLPYAILSIVGMVLTTRKKHAALLLVTVWMVSFFLYQGSQFVMSMRYFYPLYPFFAFFAGWTMSHLHADTTRGKLLIGALVLAVLVWPVAFMSIYTKPHTYVQASVWMHENAPPDALVLSEHWNDGLPFQTTGTSYTVQEIPIFVPDSPEKMAEILQAFQSADYYIIPNNRSYGSIMPLAEQFPLTTAFFDELFAGRGDMKLVKEFTSYPELRMGPFVLPFQDQWAEEAFTVYDHPRVLIFQRQ